MCRRFGDDFVSSSPVFTHVHIHNMHIHIYIHNNIQNRHICTYIDAYTYLYR